MAVRCVTAPCFARLRSQLIYLEPLQQQNAALFVNEGHLHTRFPPVQLLDMANPSFNYRDWSVADRLQLVGDIWISIADEANASPEVLPLIDDQKAELDRRLAEYDADPSSGIPMDESPGRIRSQFRRKV